MPIRALIVDDERLMREQVRIRLARAWPDLEIVAEAENGFQALELFETHTPDLAFLDIRMPGMSGLEVARELAGRCHIVFVTAYDQHAMEAFEHGAIDYLLKPVEEERLAVTVSRLKDRLKSPPAQIDDLLETLTQRLRGDAKSTFLRWIKAQIGTSLRLISIDEIVYFHAEDKYTRVFTATTEALIKKPIKELTDELDPHKFWQIHRATIVNATEIAAVTRDVRERLMVSLKHRPDKLEVSRSYAHLFKQM
jgi:DNA-binding LytR/AlgR family response regulator